MLEWITQINNAVNGVVWGPAGLALLFGTGLIMSVRTGFFAFVMTDTAVLSCGYTSCKLCDFRLRIHIYPKCVISLITACCKGMSYLLSYSPTP